jgi:hypothetical protein
MSDVSHQGSMASRPQIRAPAPKRSIALTVYVKCFHEYHGEDVWGPSVPFPDSGGHFTKLKNKKKGSVELTKLVAQDEIWWKLPTKISISWTIST